MARTVDNLMKMFTSGSEANIRYMAFAEAADKEGQPNAAKIFRAIATAKMFHALSHFRATKYTETTAENLKQALKEETYDFKNAYPPMVQDAVNDDAFGLGVATAKNLQKKLCFGILLVGSFTFLSGGVEAFSDRHSSSSNKESLAPIACIRNNGPLLHDRIDSAFRSKP